LVGQVAARVLALGSGRLRVGIDGRTAAGKTSFGHELAQHLSAAGRPVLRAGLDDFKQPWRHRHRYDRESGEGYYRNAYDYDAVQRLLLQPCTDEGSGEVVLCSIDPLTQLDHSDVLTTAAPDAVLIVDGVFAFRPEIDRWWDFRIWLDVSSSASIERGTVRDEYWAGAESEALHRDRYGVAEEIHLAEVHPELRADIVIDNSDFARPRIVRG
jgi:uridine kinase